MDLIALGKLLKQHRNRLGLSQFNFAIKMGLPSPGKLAEYELGNIQPKADTLARLAESLELNHTEVNELYVLAGYSPPTRMPDRARIETVIAEIAKVARDTPYPIYVADYRWRAWMMNPATWRFAGRTSGEIRVLLTRGLSLLDMAFDTRLPWLGTFVNREEFQAVQAARMKATNARFLHDAHSQNLMPSLRDRWSHADFANFETKWKAVDVARLDGVPAVPSLIVRTAEGELHVLFRVTPILQLGQLFNEVHVMPNLAIDGTAQVVERLRRQLDPPEPCLELWRMTPDYYL